MQRRLEDAEMQRVAELNVREQVRRARLRAIVKLLVENSMRVWDVCWFVVVDARSLIHCALFNNA